MASIAQRRLFGWKEIDELGDLERLKLVLDTIPPAWAYSRFLKVILRHSEELVGISQQLVSAIGEAVPDFGEGLAMDGKKLPYFGNPVNDEDKKE